MTVSAVVHMVMDEVRIKIASVGYAMKEGPEKALMQERWRIKIKATNKRNTIYKLDSTTGGSCKNQY